MAPAVFPGSVIIVFGSGRRKNVFSDIRPAVGSQILYSPCINNSLCTLIFQMPGVGFLKRIMISWLPVALSAPL